MGWNSELELGISQGQSIMSLNGGFDQNLGHDGLTSAMFLGINAPVNSAALPDKDSSVSIPSSNLLL